MHTQTPRRVLAIYAHPDDAELWAGGTLLRHRALGDRTAICVLTHGDSGRAEEARRGASLLHAQLYQFAFPDRTLRAERALVAEVAEVLRTEQPQIILTHWHDDIHPDHEATWTAVRAAVLAAEVENSLQAMYWSDTYNGLGLHGAFEPDCLVDVSSQWEAKLTALHAHASQQPQQYVDMTTRQCALHGARGGVRYAEGFRRVPLFGRVRSARASLWEDIDEQGAS